MLFYFTLPLMDHLAYMEITNKNAASGGAQAQAQQNPPKCL
jgi:hypothetical protein